MRPTLSSNIRVAPDTRGMNQAIGNTLNTLGQIEQMRLADEQQKVKQYNKALDASYQDVWDRDRDEYQKKRQGFENRLNEIYRKTGGELGYDEQKEINTLTRELDDFVGTSTEMKDEYRKTMQEIAKNPKKYDIEATKAGLSEVMKQERLADRAKQWYGYDWMQPAVEKVDFSDAVKGMKDAVEAKSLPPEILGEKDAAGNYTYKEGKYRPDKLVRDYAKAVYQKNPDGWKKYHNMNTWEDLYKTMQPYASLSPDYKLSKAAKNGGSYGINKDGSLLFSSTTDEVPISEDGKTTAQVTSATTVPGQGVNNLEIGDQQADLVNVKVLPVIDGKEWINVTGENDEDADYVYKDNEGKAIIGNKILTDDDRGKVGETDVEYKPYAIFQVDKPEDENGGDAWKQNMAANFKERFSNVQVNIYEKGDKMLIRVPYEKDSDVRLNLRDHNKFGSEKDEYIWKVSDELNKKRTKDFFTNKFK